MWLSIENIKNEHRTEQIGILDPSRLHLNKEAITVIHTPYKLLAPLAIQPHRFHPKPHPSTPSNPETPQQAKNPPTSNLPPRKVTHRHRKLPLKTTSPEREAIRRPGFRKETTD
jgi:hypothetical protein